MRSSSLVAVLPGRDSTQGQSTLVYRHLHGFSLTCRLPFISMLDHLAQSRTKPFFLFQYFDKKKLLRFAFYSL
jgi:hypothetical protein